MAGEIVDAVLAPVRELNRVVLQCCGGLDQRLDQYGLERLARIPTLLIGVGEDPLGPLGPFDLRASIQMLTEVVVHLSRWLNEAPGLATLFFGVSPAVLQQIATLSLAERRDWIQQFGPRIRLRWDERLWHQLVTATLSGDLKLFHRAARHGLALVSAELLRSLRQTPITLRGSRAGIPHEPEAFYRWRIALRERMWQQAVPRKTISRLTLFSRGQLDHAHRHHRTPLPRAPSGQPPSNVYEQLVRGSPHGEAAALVAAVHALLEVFLSPGGTDRFQAVVDTWTTYEAGLVWSPGCPLGFPQFELLVDALRRGELELTECEWCTGIVLKHAGVKQACEWCRRACA